jgi:hypothetical protein
MAFTLEDIQNAPMDPEELNRHLINRGSILPPAPSPLMSATVADMTKPTETTDTVASMTRPWATAPQPEKTSNVFAGAEPGGKPQPGAPKIPSWSPISAGAAPTMEGTIDKGGNVIQPGALPGGATPGTAPGAGIVPTMTKPSREDIEKNLTIGNTAAERKEKYNLLKPKVTAEFDTPEYAHQKAVEQDWIRNHGYGTELNHPGFLGKLAHIGAQIGNVAGEAVIPNLISQIPGTPAHRNAQIAANVAEGAAARERASTEAAKQQQIAESKTRQAGEETRTAETQQKIAKGETEQALEKDAEGNVTGWKDAQGRIHSLDEEGTPQAIKDVAAAGAGKPHYEKTENGDIVQITPGKGGQPSTSDVVYKGNPKVKTETRSIQAADGHLYDQVFDVTPGSPNFGQKLATLGRSDKPASAAHELAEMKAGEEPVIGYDKDGKMKLMPRAQAEKEGLSNRIKATDKDRQDAENNTSGLNEVGVKTRNLAGNLKALDQGFAQRAIIAQALAHSSNTAADALIRATVMRGASEQTQNFVIDAINLREAVLNLPKIMTGTSRMTEVQAEALWKTIVDGSARDSKYGMKQLRKFDEMVDRQWKKVPEIQGNPRERAFENKGGGGGGGAPKTVRLGGKDVPLNDDGTVTVDGHKYKTTPGSKNLTLAE